MKILNRVNVAWLRAFLSRRTSLVAIMMVFTTVFTVAVCASVKTVNISDGDTVITVKTLRTNAASILEFAEVDYREEDVITSSVDGGKMSVNVAHSFPVTVVFGDKTETVYVPSGTTAEKAARFAGAVLDDNDDIDCGRDTKLTEKCEIKVIAVEFVTERSVKRLYYQNKTVYDSNSSKTVVKQEGKEGTANVVTVKRFENGVCVGVESVTETVVTPAVDRIISVGTKKTAQKTSGTVGKNDNTKKSDERPYDISKVISEIVPDIKITLDKKGIPTNYKKHMTVQATAYNAPPTAHCSTGVNVRVGYIAVNPKVIPYGTKMYIISSDGKYVYGYAIAADTGGFVKTRPTGVDLFMSTEAFCNKFGRRNVEIYIF